MLLMNFMMICSLSILFLTHPISLGFMLFMQIILISMSINLFTENFWFSYILMLIMIGGLLIMFLYMTSIASNEKFKKNYKFLYLMLIIFLNVNYEFYNKNMNLTSLNFNYKFEYSLNKFYFFPNNLILFLIFIYLLITMIACVKICKINKGPLRQMF
uniref:NADH-ubiquinone oxidoreductase chain 6 n=1 Tax=Discolomatinae sp. GENSP01 TaxID=1205622 RepID=A0A0S2MNV1_9CUCU|nr:NADH deshydrogenase subunit 6 [Discolomatinae sp. GENSP01]